MLSPQRVLIIGLLLVVPSHHNHAIGERIGIRLDAEHVVAFPG